MSDTEHRIGTLFPITISEDIEISAQFLLEIMGHSRDNEQYDSAIHQLEDTGHRKLHITENVIYFIKYESIDPSSDILKAKKSDNGLIDFEVKYYNGGCSFSEALDASFKNMV